MMSVERDGAYAAVKRDGHMLWRFDRQGNPFFSAIRWPAARVVAIGAGRCVQLVDEKSERIVRTIELGMGDEGDWFGQFGEDVGDTLYVLGWENVTAVDARLSVKWVSYNVAVDGIIGGRYEDGRLLLSAEMDPPGGWEDVKLDVETGYVTSRSARSAGH